MIVSVHLKVTTLLWVLLFAGRYKIIHYNVYIYAHQTLDFDDLVPFPYANRSTRIQINVPANNCHLEVVSPASGVLILHDIVCVVC